jgi:hypothetical protein
VMMPSVERLGTIDAITYSCDIATKRGLCAADKGSLYRHAFKNHPPQLIRQAGKYGIACKIAFLDGGILDGGKTGIDDLPKDERQACAISLAKPNPHDFDIVGSLRAIEIKGEDKAYNFEGAVLCVTKDGSRLHIVDLKDINGAKILENPATALHTATHPTTAQLYGPKAWSCLHNYAALYRPEMRASATILIDDVVGKFPCETCRDHAVDYVKANPPNLDSREGFARWAFNFHNSTNAKLGKPLHRWDAEDLAPSDDACTSCSDPKAPPPHAPSLKILARHGCSHCDRTIAAAKTAGVKLDIVYDHNEPATPVLVRADGKRHVGALSAEELKEFVA